MQEKMAKNIEAIESITGFVVAQTDYLGLLCDIVDTNKSTKSPLIAFPLHNPVVKMTLTNFYDNIRKLQTIRDPKYSTGKCRSGYDTVKFLSTDDDNNHEWKPFGILGRMNTISTKTIDITLVSPYSYGSTLFPSLEFTKNLPIMKGLLAVQDFLALDLVTQEQITKFQKSMNETISPQYDPKLEIQRLDNIPEKEFDSSLVFVNEWLSTYTDINPVEVPTPFGCARRQPGSASKRKQQTVSDEESPTKRTRSGENNSDFTGTQIFTPSKEKFCPLDLNDPTIEHEKSSESRDDLDSDSNNEDENPDTDSSDDEVDVSQRLPKKKKKGRKFQESKFSAIREKIKQSAERISKHKAEFGEKYDSNDIVSANKKTMTEELCNGELDNVFISVLLRYAIKNKIMEGTQEYDDLIQGNFDPTVCMESPYADRVTYSGRKYNVNRLFAHLTFHTPTRAYASQPLAILDCSHVKCNKSNCINPHHVVLEPNSTNNERKKCHARERECFHKIKCGLNGKDILKEEVTG